MARSTFYVSTDSLVRDDTDKVLAAAKLGWLMVEVRGRYSGDLSPTEPRRDYVLPLQSERSNRERVIEAEKVLRAHCGSLDCDVQVALPGGDIVAQTPKSSEALESFGIAVLSADDGQRKRALQVLAEYLFAWDQRIQDVLAQGTSSLSDGYQAGKGFAEIAWMLVIGDVDADSHHSWDFLLSETRRDALTRILHRLEGSYGPAATHAMAASLWAWTEVANHPELRRATDAQAKLDTQSRVWRDLLVSGLSAETLLTPEDVIQNVGEWYFILKKYWGVATFGLIFIVLAVAGLAFAAAHPGLATQTWGWIASVLGLFGLTSTAVVARLKTTANGLLDQMRTALHLDLIAAAATYLPAGSERYVDRRSRARDLAWHPRPELAIPGRRRGLG